ncbi:Oxidoreductase ucpA [Wickerhamomyces ciferrii]|uniref:Oxidoreductase ucpA n=1 Tax=Wickerhamomyces ciferrii (strain ATCC 14091 / BCRC 22168 / CBS 111 / JCM 3599 / NBRC 0793 / NRRL Y-1031 F-60-10) TaxID=1206466 RepID=K0KFC8_WICCF|nr:Oxidoreductase ucpA [Wickerhamomyces ciferrii]CCH40932.1 Oxidoreductase ucpA [Wickerhamomyces ciferrii]
MTETTYFITGTNRGIGLELVKQLLQDPSNHVIATLRRIDDYPEVFVTKNPNLTILRLDYNSDNYQSNYESLANELAKLDKGIDVFIANAAKNDSITNVLDSSLDDYLQFLRINTLGPIETLKILKPYLLKKKTRKIIFTSSILGSIGEFPFFLNKQYPCAPYCLSKAGSNSLGKILSFELANEGFIVINYHPGLINTKKNENVSDDDFGALKKEFEPDQTLLDYVVKNTLSVQEGVTRELKIINSLTASDNGKFLTHDGSELPY